jgi:hypothetical protein
MIAIPRRLARAGWLPHSIQEMSMSEKQDDVMRLSGAVQERIEDEQAVTVVRETGLLSFVATRVEESALPASAIVAHLMEMIARHVNLARMQLESGMLEQGQRGVERLALALATLIEDYILNGQSGPSAALRVEAEKDRLNTGER